MTVLAHRTPDRGYLARMFTLLAVGWFGAATGCIDAHAGGLAVTADDLAADIEAGRNGWWTEVYDCATHAAPTATRPVCVRLWLRDPPHRVVPPVSAECASGDTPARHAGFPQPWDPGRGQLRFRFEQLRTTDPRVTCVIRSGAHRWEETPTVPVLPSDRSWDYGLRIVSIEAPVSDRSPGGACRITPCPEPTWFARIHLENTGAHPIDHADVSCALDGATPPVPISDAAYQPGWHAPWNAKAPGATWEVTVRLGQGIALGEHAVHCTAALLAPYLPTPLVEARARLPFEHAAP